jgi:hypothetical protein
MSKKEEVREKEEIKEEVKPATVEEDDEWGAVPAFLRRSKIK